MSATPRTDGAELTGPHEVRELGFCVVRADFARELERELQEAQAKLQWFMENQNQVAMELMRPVEEENARLRQLEREVQQCKEIVWQAALAQSGRCGITERLLLRLYNDMERASPTPDTKTP